MLHSGLVKPERIIGLQYSLMKTGGLVEKMSLTNKYVNMSIYRKITDI